MSASAMCTETSSSRPKPAALAMLRMFANACLNSSSTVPGRYSPVSGSVAGWPEMKQRFPATTAGEKGQSPPGTPSPLVMYVWPTALGARARDELLRRFEVGRSHQDLARPSRGEILQRRIDRLRVAVRAVDAVRLEQAADDERLRLVRDDREDDAFAGLHEGSLGEERLQRFPCDHETALDELLPALEAPVLV